MPTLQFPVLNIYEDRSDSQPFARTALVFGGSRELLYARQTIRELDSRPPKKSSPEPPAKKAGKLGREVVGCPVGSWDQSLVTGLYRYYPVI